MLVIFYFFGISFTFYLLKMLFLGTVINQASYFSTRQVTSMLLLSNIALVEAQRKFIIALSAIDLTYNFLTVTHFWYYIEKENPWKLLKKLITELGKGMFIALLLVCRLEKGY